MTAATPGSAELLALAEQIEKDGVTVHGVWHPKAVVTKMIIDALRLAAKPAEASAEQRLDEDMTLFSNVRAETIEECAKITDKVSASLSEYSKRAEAAGDTQTMYRANTAWHNTTGIAEMIRALSTGAPKP